MNCDSFCSPISEIVPQVLASSNVDPLVTQTATITKDAPATKQIEFEIDLSNSLESTVKHFHLMVNDQQGNPLPPPSLNLYAPIHVLGETYVCMRDENEKDGVRVEGASLDQWVSGPEIESAQRSKGGRPTQKIQEMQWTTVGGRGHCGRGGHGGRGHFNN